MEGRNAVCLGSMAASVGVFIGACVFYAPSDAQFIAFAPTAVLFLSLSTVAVATLTTALVCLADPTRSPRVFFVVFLLVSIYFFAPNVVTSALGLKIHAANMMRPILLVLLLLWNLRRKPASLAP